MLPGLTLTPMNKVEHIGIAVKDLSRSLELFRKLLGQEHYKIEEVATEGVRTACFKVGETKIELLEATSPDSPIAKFIEKRGEGIHHIAFDVDNIQQQMAQLAAHDFTLLNPQPKAGADQKEVCFIHPKSANGVLVELCADAKT